MPKARSQNKNLNQRKKIWNFSAMNKKIKIGIVLGLLITGLAFFGYLKAIPKSENQTNLPKIEVSPKTYDFGEINYGEVMNYTFEVKNAGTRPLEIKRVATSCSCTTAKIGKENLAPGETTQLSVRYDSGAMGSSHGKGEQERIIYLRST